MTNLEGQALREVSEGLFPDNYIEFVGWASGVWAIFAVYGPGAYVIATVIVALFDGVEA